MGNDTAVQRNTLRFGEGSELLAPDAEKEFFDWQRDKFALIRRTLATLPERSAVADIGCFTGVGAATYRDVPGVQSVHGFDLSEAALQAASRRGIVPCRWVAGSEPCPAPSHQFDVVVAADIIEHLVDTDSFVAELRRIVKPQGHIIVTTPNLGWWLNRLRLLFGKIPWSYPGVSSRHAKSLMVDVHHLRVSLADEWVHLFAQYDLSTEELLGYRMNSPLSGWKLAIDHVVRHPTLMFGNLFLLRPR